MKQILAATLLVSIPLAASAQDDDQGYLTRLIEDNLSGEERTVDIQGFAGAFSSTATIDRLTVSDADGIWLSLENITLNWNRTALLRGRIDVETLLAERIVLARGPVSSGTAAVPSAEATPFSLPELPVSIRLGELDIGRIELGDSFLGEPAVFGLTGSATLADGNGTASIRANRLDGPLGRFAIEGSYDNATTRLDLGLDLTEGPSGIVARLANIPGQPELALQLSGAGPLSDFSAELSLATDGEDRLTGNLTLLDDNGQSRFDAAVSGNIAPLFAPDYQDFFGTDVRLVASGAQRAGGGFDLSTLDLTADKLRLQGGAAIDAGGWPERLSLTGAITDPTGAAVLLPLAGPKTYVSALALNIGYDRATSDDWTADFNIDSLDRPGLFVEDISLRGGGVIEQGNGPAVGRVTARLAYAASGVELDDTGAAQAMGDTVEGEFDLTYVEGAPTRIDRLTLTGPGVDLLADATIGTAAENRAVQANLALTAEALSRFATLAAQPALAGAAALNVASTISPLDGRYALDVDGTTTDLAIGIAQLDPLLAGAGTISVQAVRDTTGTRLDNLRIATSEALVTATADITDGVSSAAFDVTVNQLALVVEGLEGRANLTGTAGRDGADVITFDVNGTAPATILMARGTVNPSETGQTVNAAVGMNVTDLTRFRAISGQPLAGSAAIAATGVLLSDGARFTADVVAETTDLETGIAQVDALLSGDGTLAAKLARISADHYQLSDLSVQTTALDLVGNADGSLAGAARAMLDATINDAGLLAAGLNGPLDLDLTADRDDGGVARVDLTARGNGTDIALNATAAPNASIFDVQGALTAQVPDLSPYAALAGRALSGALSADVSGTVKSDLSAYDTRFDITTRDVAVGDDRIDPILVGEGALTGTAARRDGGVATADLAATLPGTDLRLNGTATPQGELFALNGRLDADVADLAPFARIAGRPLSGGISADIAGSLVTDGADFDLDFTLGTRNLTTGDARIDPLLTRNGALRGSANRTGNGTAAITAQASLASTSAQIDATATPQGDAFALAGTASAQINTLTAYRGLAGLPLSGAFNADVTGSLMTDLSAFDAQIAVTTASPAIGNPSVDQLLRGAGSLNASAMRTPSGGITLRSFSAQTPQLSASGSGNATASGTGNAQFQARLADVGLFTDQLSGPVTAAGTAARNAGNWGVNIDATGPGGINARVDGSVADSGTLNLDLRGAAPLGLANTLIEPRRIEGDLNFDIAVNGPPALSSVSGRLSTAGARLSAPTLGLALQDITGGLTLSGNAAQIDLTGAVQSGGTLTVTGPVGLAAPFNGDIAVVLSGVVLEDPNLYRTTADGRIALNGPLTGGARISGVVNLGQTDVQVPSSGIGSLGALPEVIHINPSAAVRQTLERAGADIRPGGNNGTGSSARGSGYPLDIAVNAPNRIFVRGRGLDAELGGALTIGGSSNAVIPVGQFDLIRGRIDILQQHFDLTEGSATLQGDFMPYLRLVAATETASGTVVRVVVEGPANAPEVSFESTPQLPQDEVLAQLIFGRNLSEISPLQAVQLAAAVGTLAGRGGGGIIDNFRQNIGLDDFDVTTDEAGNAAVRAGKYLTENVYTDVTINSEGQTEVNINLDITSEITAKGTAGADGETSIGVFFERDY